jgi:LPXTG-site transpeptidase (sortase) family protein
MPSSGILHIVQRTCETLGLLGLVLVGIVYLDAIVGSRQAVAAFEAAELKVSDPDQTLWSEEAKRKFAEASNHDELPLALLSIERLGLRVPIFPGTDRRTLNRGAGLVEATAFPGENGNMVLSAHRDSFFRPLKDIQLGDQIELRTLEGAQRFEVAEIFVTDPMDLSVLEPSNTPVVTLITCYPFYYVGYAPDRLIVRAVPSDGAQGNLAFTSGQ